MATVINLSEITSTLVENGTVLVEAIEGAIPIISIEAERKRDGGIRITKKTVGVRKVGYFFKGLNIDIELPEVVICATKQETDETFKAAIETMYPEFTVWLKVF